LTASAGLDGATVDALVLEARAKLIHPFRAIERTDPKAERLGGFS
jgi:hypothetical protein